MCDACLYQDTQPTGVIELNIYEAVSIEEKSKRFRFYLHNNNKSNIRVFRLTAPTQMELVQWVAAISQVLKVLTTRERNFWIYWIYSCVCAGGEDLI